MMATERQTNVEPGMGWNDMASNMPGAGKTEEGGRMARGRAVQ